MRDAFLELYRNRKTGEYLIQRYVGIYGVGRFVRISAAEMQWHGLEVILKCLKDEPPASAEAKPELAGFSKEEERAFYREHLNVFVSLSSPSTIKIGPLRREAGGFVAPSDEIMELPLPCSSEEFLDALSRAYEAI